MTRRLSIANTRIVLLVLFLFWRILLFIPLLVGEHLLPFRSGYEYVHLWKFIEPYSPVSQIVFYPWANFDGIHYLLIAGEGYSNNLGFLPLFPWTIYLVTSLFSISETYGVVQFFVGFLLAIGVFKP